jgi:uncharacterized membrane protein
MARKRILTASTIPVVAVMTAITTVLTFAIRIPSAPTRGYFNLSDAMIYFSSPAFGPWIGGAIGGLGPALSDLISGYPQWAAFTFVIDGGQAVLMGVLVKKFRPAYLIFGSVISAVWKVLGYLAAGSFLSGWGPALTEVPGNCVQAVFGLAVGLTLFTAIRKAYPPLVRFGNLGYEMSLPRNGK